MWGVDYQFFMVLSYNVRVVGLASLHALAMSQDSLRNLASCTLHYLILWKLNPLSQSNRPGRNLVKILYCEYLVLQAVITVNTTMLIKPTSISNLACF